MIKEGVSKASLRSPCSNERAKDNVNKLGEDICLAGTSIDDDTELLKLGQKMRDNHKNLS